ncbi:hypothetical protein ACIA8G_35270 [Lentzea sp. NPDC051213]|uniref:hypothetical protein n=1 Tax=Lentzea sp. NPDC051213 TaxID=3364126 RepID=UPI0037B02F4D
MQWKLLVPGLALGVVGSLGVASEHLQVLTVQRQQAEQAHDYQVSQMLPRSPQDELQVFHSLLARRETRRACFLLAEPIRPVFAAAQGEGDCVAAMEKLSGQITDKGRYELPIYDAATAISVQGDRATVDACAVYWNTFTRPPVDAGPRLGRWEMQRQHGNGYLITGWQSCPATSTPPAVSSTPSSAAARHVPPPTTSSTGARWLPSYPPGYPAVLAAAIGRGNTDVCESMFTDTGREQFARVVGAATCADAITALSAKVTDATNYANPRGAYSIPGAPGHVTVDACSLTWASATTGTRPPGPQLGRLSLRTQTGGVGYLVVGVTPC